MQYDSDYDVRLATLGALGGDTTRYFDSLYAIDIAILEAIEQGGGGGGEGLTWAQIKGLLISSGVSEIKFNDGASSVTLDYDLISQIGQGGMDYDEVKADLSASGVTEIKFNDSGDTTSVTLDYDLISQIGQGGMDYDDVKDALSASGVTEIKFNDGASSSITLDYAEIAKIDTAVQMYDGSVKKIRVMSQSDYDLLETKDNNIIYYTYTE